jgi:5-methylcytosine-specific restriction endonuclease McrA
MFEPSDFSFLNQDPLWDEEEAERVRIHNMIDAGESVLASFKRKVSRSAYLYSQERKQRSRTSFETFISPENMRVRKLRSQRLNRILRPYWEWLIDRLGYECQACHHVFNSADLEVDHCRPLSRKGKNEWDNIQPLCGPCNRRKNAKTFFSPEVISAQKEWKKTNRRKNVRRSRQETIEQGENGCLYDPSEGRV